jgi:hypothetical protein
MHVDLWANTKGQTRVMAVIRAAGGQVQVEEKEPVPPRIRQDIEKQRQRLPGDEAFLKSLPVEFSGTYYRAQFVKE